MKKVKISLLIVVALIAVTIITFIIKHDDILIKKINGKNQELKNTESFYGEWTVKRIIGFAKISGIYDNEIKSMINKKIIYNSKQANLNNKIIDNPYFKKTTVTNNKFLDGYVYLKEI